MGIEKMTLATIIDERVTEELVTQYLLRPVGVLDGGIWVNVDDISPDDLEPRSREALCGGDHSARPTTP
jgi:hypothetical protein